MVFKLELAAAIQKVCSQGTEHCKAHGGYRAHLCVTLRRAGAEFVRAAHTALHAFIPAWGTKPKSD